MSKYEELRASFSGFSDAERSFQRQNEFIAEQIVYGFKEWAEVPNSFERPEGNQTIHEPYITFYEWDEGKLGDKFSYLPKALMHCSDGSFTFAFGVTLERAENTYPKTNLILNVECRRNNNKVSVTISDRTVEVEFDGETIVGIEKTHHLIFDLLTAYLARRSGDGKGRLPFGFSITSR